jgi:hypothetical protein
MPNNDRDTLGTLRHGVDNFNWTIAILRLITLQGSRGLYHHPQSRHRSDEHLKIVRPDASNSIIAHARTLGFSTLRQVFYEASPVALTAC